MRSLVLLTTLLVCPAVFAQDGLSRVETIGQTTIYAPPTHVEFWLFYSGRDANLELAMEDAQGFEGRVREGLEAAELRPMAFEITSPALPDVRENRVEIAALLRFSMSTFYHPQNGPAEFAKLCDKIKEIAREVEAEITGPVLDTTNREALMQQAVTEATEDALPTAEALARTIRGSLSAVETVQVLEVLWNQPLEYQGVTPTVRQMAITARVRVTYAVAGQG